MKVSRSKLRRILRESVKELYGECQNEVYGMAQDNGYVCCLCVSKAVEACGMGPADMDLCCQILEDCVLSGMLRAGKCPEYPEITVYFPVM